MRSVAAPLLLLFAPVACQGTPSDGFPLDTCNGLHAELIDHATAPPANVSLLVRVTDCARSPLGKRLDPSAFSLSEDGVALSPFEAGREILPATRQISERTLIALDISGSITGAGLRDGMIDSATRLLPPLTGGRSIGIFEFDGRPDLVPATYFSMDPQTIADALTRARTDPLVDDSTNLYGAVMSGLSILDRATQADARDVYAVAHGTLIVFTDGGDLAHRVDDGTLSDALDNTPHSTFAIGVGPNADDGALAHISRTGHFASPTDPAISGAFDLDMMHVEAKAEANYVVSYCSPSRAGQRTLGITITDGASQVRVSFDFDSTGFSAGCTPSASPLR
jgi:hypothetical protein